MRATRTRTTSGRAPVCQRGAQLGRGFPVIRADPSPPEMRRWFFHQL